MDFLAAPIAHRWRMAPGCKNQKVRSLPANGALENMSTQVPLTTAIKLKLPASLAFPVSNEKKEHPFGNMNFCAKMRKKEGASEMLLDLLIEYQCSLTLQKIKARMCAKNKIESQHTFYKYPHYHIHVP